MRFYLAILLLLFYGTLRAQDDSDTVALQKAKAALKEAEAAVDAASHKKTKPSVPSAKPKFTPIEIQQYGWGNHASVGYYHDGLEIRNLQQFEEAIDPLGDAEASGLLRSSADKSGWGTGLIWGGIATTAAGWVDFVAVLGNMSQTTYKNGVPVTTYNDNIDLGPFFILITAGTIGWVSGLLLQVDAGNDRYNAVNRYNYVVQSDQSLSLMTQPGSSPMGLSFTQRF
jgi:hypothetical protein